MYLTSFPQVIEIPLLSQKQGELPRLTPKIIGPFPYLNNGCKSLDPNLIKRSIIYFRIKYLMSTKYN